MGNEKEKERQPLIILLNTSMRGMRLLLRVPASSVYEEEDPLLARRILRVHDIRGVRKLEHAK